MIWLIEGIVIILASFVIGIIISRAIKSVNGDDE